MKISKERIIDYLRTEGRLNTAGEAFSALPDMVDTEDDANLLATLEIVPEELPTGHPPGPAGLGNVRTGPHENPERDHPPGPAGLGEAGETDDADDDLRDDYPSDPDGLSVVRDFDDDDRDDEDDFDDDEDEDEDDDEDDRDL
jgi:hypothetical protein